MLKCSTGTTNTNSQSSRLQCIINIHGIADKSNVKDNDQANDSFLSIVDLAMAEREKRTGNQVFFMEPDCSNVISSTTYQWLLTCASDPYWSIRRNQRSHCRSTFTTLWYLRDYLEGKKRMALILKVKSGKDDYRDTSYVLRQAHLIWKSSIIMLKKNQISHTTKGISKLRLEVSSPKE